MYRIGMLTYPLSMGNVKDTNRQAEQDLASHALIDIADSAVEFIDDDTFANLLAVETTRWASLAERLK